MKFQDFEYKENNNKSFLAGKKSHEDLGIKKIADFSTAIF